jgi:TetR/AcrR family transcriptional regulator, mexCD-oprJ operon repressor
VSPNAPRQALQQRVTAAIVDAAARVLAATGGTASMADVAAEAGVARATVYRYFPSRQVLLEELATVAVADASARLTAARIDQLPVADSVPRAVRALVDVGDPFVVLVREHTRGDPERFDAGVAAPLRELFARGQEDGDIRTDADAAWLTEFLIGVVMSVLFASRTLGREDVIVLATSLFFDGARRRGPRLEVVQ